MSSRFIRIWNQLSQFRQLFAAATAAIGLTGLVGATMLVLVVSGEYRRHDEHQLVRAAEAAVATLARQARSLEPESVRQVLAQYQIVPGLVGSRLIDSRGEQVAMFDRDGASAVSLIGEAPAGRQPTLVDVDSSWLPFTAKVQRLWFPAGWQGFSGWLVIDQRMDHLSAMRAWIIAPAAFLVLAIYGAIVAVMWWLSSGQQRALAALEQYVKRGGTAAYPSVDQLRAPRELWGFAEALRHAWKHLKQNQREIEVAGRRNHELFQAYHDPAFIIDEHGQILVANRAGQAMFGFSPAEFEGMHADQLVADESMNDYREWWKEYWRTGAAPRQDRPLRIRGLRRNRKTFEAEITLVQIRGGEGSEFAVTYRDISESIANDARLSSAIRTAEEASRARNTFVATVSHELRTPMNGILGMADLALASAPSTSVREYLTTIRSCGRQMAAIVDDVLDISRMDAGRLDMDMRPFDARGLLAELRAVYEPVASHKGLKFSVELRGQMPQAIIGDSVRIRQVLDNLLVNAFKFTDAGSVQVVCEAVAGKARGEAGAPGARQPVDIVVSVADTGIGVPTDRQDAIFEPFTQGDNATARRFGGVGLGLSLSRRLVQLMGGMLWLESQPGKGSVFTMSLPCIPASPEELENLRAAWADGDSEVATQASLLADRIGAVRVIVAEDNEINRRLIEEVLTRQGLRVTACSDGQQALEAWRAQVAELVITDLAMPRLDGYELSSAIRELESGSGHARRVRILGFSASSGTEVIERCQAAGMDECLFKPIESARLLARVAELLLDQTRDGQPAEPLDRRLGGVHPVDEDKPAGLKVWGLSSSGDPRLMQRILGLAIKELPDRIERLREAANSGDTLWIQRHAHSLVNTLVALSQTEAADLARMVEAGAAQDRIALDAAIEPLARAVEAVLPGLQHQLAELEASQLAVH
ncbi:MAG: ATP-binding protein [Burkholderiaceae bacterium]